MSHNEDNVERSARNHRPAIIGIIVAAVVAVIALMVYAPLGDDTHAEDPAGNVAAGTDGTQAPQVSPEGAAPSPGN